MSSYRRVRKGVCPPRGRTGPDRPYERVRLLSGKVFLLRRLFHVTSPVMSTSKRAALYLRVSTPDQKPDLQFDGLRQYADRAGL